MTIIAILPNLITWIGYFFMEWYHLANKKKLTKFQFRNDIDYFCLANLHASVTAKSDRKTQIFNPWPAHKGVLGLLYVNFLKSKYCAPALNFFPGCNI